MYDGIKTNSRRLAQSPGLNRWMQELYSRSESLEEAGAGLGRAIAALTACRDADQSETLIELEQIAAGIRRDRAVLDRRIRRMEALRGHY